MAGAATDKARYWVFLDDDIEFLGGDVLGDCVKAMVRNRWAGCSIFSTFDVEHKRGPGTMRPGGVNSSSRASSRSGMPVG